MIGHVSWFRRIVDTSIPLLLARVFLAAIFLYMGSMKIGDPFVFLKQVRQFEMLPESPPIYLNATAIVLPWLEIITGVALLIGLRFRGAAAAIVLMLLVFTPAILIRALHIQAEKGISFFDVAFDCGCGSGVVVIWTKLLGNVGLLILALGILLSRSNRFSLTAWFNPHPSIAAA